VWIIWTYLKDPMRTLTFSTYESLYLRDTGTSFRFKLPDFLLIMSMWYSRNVSYYYLITVLYMILCTKKNSYLFISCVIVLTLI